MTDSGDANSLVGIGELVNDAIGADAQGPQAAQPAAKGVAGAGLAREHAEGLLDGIDQRPVEVEQLAACATREDDVSHGSAARSAFGQLAAKVLK
jgi:hypothetical protein